MTSWDKFDETSLPPKEVFHSKLNMSDISDEDYSYAQAVWAECGIQNLGEYQDLYFQTDVILLSNVFVDIQIYLFTAVMKSTLSVEFALVRTLWVVKWERSKS